MLQLQCEAAIHSLDKRALSDVVRLNVTEPGTPGSVRERDVSRGNSITTASRLIRTIDFTSNHGARSRQRIIAIQPRRLFLGHPC